MIECFLFSNEFWKKRRLDVIELEVWYHLIIRTKMCFTYTLVLWKSWRKLRNNREKHFCKEKALKFVLKGIINGFKPILEFFALFLRFLICFALTDKIEFREPFERLISDFNKRLHLTQRYYTKWQNNKYFLIWIQFRELLAQNESELNWMQESPELCIGFALHLMDFVIKLSE